MTSVVGKVATEAVKTFSQMFVNALAEDGAGTAEEPTRKSTAISTRCSPAWAQFTPVLIRAGQKLEWADMNNFERIDWLMDHTSDDARRESLEALGADVAWWEQAVRLAQSNDPHLMTYLGMPPITGPPN